MGRYPRTTVKCVGCGVVNNLEDMPKKGMYKTKNGKKQAYRNRCFKCACKRQKEKWYNCNGRKGKKNPKIKAGMSNARFNHARKKLKPHIEKKLTFKGNPSDIYHQRKIDRIGKKKCISKYRWKRAEKKLIIFVMEIMITKQRHNL